MTVKRVEIVAPVERKVDASAAWEDTLAVADTMADVGGVADLVSATLAWVAGARVRVKVRAEWEVGRSEDSIQSRLVVE